MISVTPGSGSGTNEESTIETRKRLGRPKWNRSASSLLPESDEEEALAAKAADRAAARMLMRV
jgi:hypothetical protein